MQTVAYSIGAVILLGIVGFFVWIGIDLMNQPVRDVTIEPYYEQETVPIRIQEQEAASSTELKLSTTTEEKAPNAPLIKVQ